MEYYTGISGYERMRMRGDFMRRIMEREARRLGLAIIPIETHRERERRQREITDDRYLPMWCEEIERRHERTVEYHRNH